MNATRNRIRQKRRSILFVEWIVLSKIAYLSLIMNPGLAFTSSYMSQIYSDIIPRPNRVSPLNSELMMRIDVQPGSENPISLYAPMSFRIMDNTIRNIENKKTG